MIPLPSQPKIIKKDKDRAIFKIEGLYPGYGITIGNSLRRVLLSSLEGAAVTKVKIKGVQHEFSTISGVMEDVIDICQNLKRLKFKIYSPEPQKASLKVSGEREVTGEDFDLSSQLELVNKSEHIATITNKNTSLEMEIQIEFGKGYVPAEQMKERKKLSAGEIQLDAIFSPVIKVAFHVENMRVGERTDFNKLELDVITDGTASPEEVLVKASEILVKHFSLVSDEFSEEKKSKKKKKKKEQKQEKADVEESSTKISVEDMKLSSRTTNALLSNSIKTIGDILEKTEKTLLEIDGMGDKGIKEIKKALKKLGLELK